MSAFDFFRGSYRWILSFPQVRDYIHVVDLADGHIAALNKLDDSKIGTILDFIIFF